MRIDLLCASSLCSHTSFRALPFLCGRSIRTQPAPRTTGACFGSFATIRPRVEDQPWAAAQEWFQGTLCSADGSLRSILSQPAACAMHGPCRTGDRSGCREGKIFGMGATRWKGRTPARIHLDANSRRTGSRAFCSFLLSSARAPSAHPGLSPSGPLLRATLPHDYPRQCT